jgi:hypothetical protein
LIQKIVHDLAVLAVIESHFAALDYHMLNSLFSIAPDEILISTVQPVLGEHSLKLIFFDDVAESVKYLLAHNQKFPASRQRIDGAFREAISAFNRTYRTPAALMDTASYSPGATPRCHTHPNDLTSLTPKTMQISVYKPPIEIKTLKQRHERQGGEQLIDPGSHYSLERFELRLQGFTAHDLLQSMRRFFLNMCDETIDVADKVQFGQNTYQGIAIENHHLMRRRINAFLGQTAHVSVADGIPLITDAPTWAVEAVTAVLTTWRALKKVKKTALYCDRTPFAEDVELDCPEVYAVRAGIFAAAYEKFPKLTAEAKRSGHALKRKPTAVEEQDEITYDDVVAAAFLLPHIMRLELVKEFVKAEIETQQMINNDTPEKGADKVGDSGEGDE